VLARAGSRPPLGWPAFFGITIVAAVPALLLLVLPSHHNAGAVEPEK